MPVGEQVSLTRQTAISRTALLAAATTNTTLDNTDGGAGKNSDSFAPNVNTTGVHGAQIVEIQKFGSGTCSITPMGSRDGGLTWYQVGYQKINAVSTVARAVGAFSVIAGEVRAVLQLLDYYPMIRLAVTATNGIVNSSAWIDGVGA